MGAVHGNTCSSSQRSWNWTGYAHAYGHACAHAYGHACAHAYGHACDLPSATGVLQASLRQHLNVTYVKKHPVTTDTAKALQKWADGYLMGLQ